MAEAEGVCGPEGLTGFGGDLFVAEEEVEVWAAVAEAGNVFERWVGFGSEVLGVAIVAEVGVSSGRAPGAGERSGSRSTTTQGRDMERNRYVTETTDPNSVGTYLFSGPSFPWYGFSFHGIGSQRR